MIEQHFGNVCYMQFEQLRQFPEMIHGVFTRQGGYSEGEYSSLNSLGTLKGGDNLDHVVRNRQLALQALSIADYPCVTLWNVHGSEVLVPDDMAHWRTDWAYPSYYEQKWTPEEIHKGDAIVMRQRGIAAALSFADCVPIVLYDPEQQVIGIAHGGWRGTARGIVLATVETMRERFGCRPDTIYAGIGPSIGPCCYNVSEQAYRIFLGEEQFEDEPTCEAYRALVRESATFLSDEQADGITYRPDLSEINRRQLQLAGLAPEHIEVAGICTGCNTDRFFSHRKENNRTGRFPVIVALRDAK